MVSTQNTSLEHYYDCSRSFPPVLHPLWISHSSPWRTSLSQMSVSSDKSNMPVQKVCVTSEKITCAEACLFSSIYAVLFTCLSGQSRKCILLYPISIGPNKVLLGCFYCQLFVCLFVCAMVSCSPGWSGTCYINKNDLELMVFLLYLPSWVLRFWTYDNMLGSYPRFPTYKALYLLNCIRSTIHPLYFKRMSSSDNITTGLQNA